jgi:predicted ester cyclase
MTNAAKSRHHIDKFAADPAEALIQRFYDLFDTGRLNDFADSVHTDFSANVLGTTELDWGGFMHFGQSFRSAFPNGKHSFEYVVADQDSVVTIGTYEGTHLGDLQGIEATRRAIKLRVMHLDRLADGKLIEHRGLANEVDFMRQLGIDLAP